MGGGSFLGTEIKQGKHSFLYLLTSSAILGNQTLVLKYQMVLDSPKPCDLCDRSSTLLISLLEDNYTHTFNLYAIQTESSSKIWA